MIPLALKMLIGNRAAFIGVIFGIFLATLLISQQSAIFLGIISRSYRFITDIPAPNIWVIDPATESADKVRTMPSGYLDIVRGIPNVEWAVPINVISLPVVGSSGTFQICDLYGIDDATLIGAPTNIIEGNVRDLRRQGGIIVDIFSARDSLAKILPDKTKVPLTIGDEVEINGHRAVVVGICKITQGFYPQPIIFTTISNFQVFHPDPARRISFIAVKSAQEADVNEVTKKISAHPGMEALTRDQFKSKIITFFLKTGILINFGLSLALGFIIGFSISGQIFYIMTLQNLMYYALIKALGGTKKMIIQMISCQALLVGIVGFSCGIIATLLWGMAIKETTLAFLFPWELLLLTGITILVICIGTAILSIRKVFHVDPKVLMGN